MTSSALLQTARRTFLISALAATPVMLATPSVAGGSTGTPQSCGTVPNGDFQEGLAGWFTDVSRGGFGRIFNQAEIGTCEGDSVVDVELCLNAFVKLEAPGPGSTGNGAQARLSVGKRLLATDRYLEFDMSGGFGAGMFGAPDGRLLGLLVVSDASGNLYRETFVDQPLLIPQPCDTGVAFSGILADATVSVDLVAEGFTVGQELTFEVVWSVTMVSLDDCDWGDYGGGLFLDDVRFCDRPSPSVTVPAQSLEQPLASVAEAEAHSWALLPPREQLLRLRHEFAATTR